MMTRMTFYQRTKAVGQMLCSLYIVWHLGLLVAVWL